MSKKDQQPENENDHQTPSPIGEIEHGPSGMEAFLDAHQKKLILVGIILIIASIAYVITSGLAKKKTESSSAEVSAASTLVELNAVFEKYRDTPAGATALIKIASEQWANQQQEDAVTTLKDAISQYPNHPNLGSMHAQLGNYFRTMGNKEDAKTQFESAVTTDSAVSSYALQQLAAFAMQEGDEESAKNYLDRVINDYGKRHLNFKGISEELKKLIGITPAKEVAPEPAKPTEAGSNAITIPSAANSTPDELPDLPELPQLPEAPEPVEAPAPASPKE